MNNEGSIEIETIEKITLTLKPVRSNQLKKKVLEKFNFGQEERDRVVRLIEGPSNHEDSQEIQFAIIKPEDYGNKNGVDSWFIRDFVQRIGVMSYPRTVARLALYLRDHGMELPAHVRDNFLGVLSFGEEIGGPFIPGLGKPQTFLRILCGSTSFRLDTDMVYAQSTGSFIIGPKKYLFIEKK
ncbi:MAG: hypothetical protein AAB683_02530 [Patescibacteria group bacterium]